MYVSTLYLSSDTPGEGIGCQYRWLWATMWFVGFELRTSGRAVGALNRWAISPAPTIHLWIRVLLCFLSVLLPAWVRRLMDTCEQASVCTCVQWSWGRPKSGNVESRGESVFKVLEELSNRFSKRLVGPFYIPSSTEGRFFSASLTCLFFF